MDYLIQIAAWTFLPNIGAGILHNSIYTMGLKSREQAGSPAWNSDKNRCYVVVILAYLLYLLFSIESKLGASFYQVIGVFPYADERDIRTAYRKASLLYHPDKILGSRIEAEAKFQAINNAYEILKDPLKKNVYDHLGASGLSSCEKCLTFKEYFYDAIGESIGFYAGTCIGITSIGMMGGNLYAPYWRFILFIALVTLDLAWKTSISDPLPYLMYWRTPAEKIIMARELFIMVSIAMSQIGPFFFPVDSRSLKDLILELEEFTHKELDSSVNRMIRTYGPFAEKGSGALNSKLERHYIERQLEVDPEFAGAQKAFLEFAGAQKTAGHR